MKTSNILPNAAKVNTKHVAWSGSIRPNVLSLVEGCQPHVHVVDGAVNSVHQLIYGPRIVVDVL